MTTIDLMPAIIALSSMGGLLYFGIRNLQKDQSRQEARYWQRECVELEYENEFLRELGIPDYSTLCRNRLAQDDTLSELPGLINRQLTEKSLKSAAVIATVNPAMCGQPIENQTTKPVKKYFI